MDCQIWYMMSHRLLWCKIIQLCMDDYLMLHRSLQPPHIPQFSWTMGMIKMLQYFFGYWLWWPFFTFIISVAKCINNYLWFSLCLFQVWYYFGFVPNIGVILVSPLPLEHNISWGLYICVIILDHLPSAISGFQCVHWNEFNL